VAALLLLIGLVTAQIGLFLWFTYQLHATRDEMERYHHHKASLHLLRCLQMRPDDPDVLILAARSARRMGGLDDAEQFLDRYQQQRGTDDSLVLERMLLRAEQGAIEDVREFFRTRVEEEHPDSPLIFEAITRGFLRLYRLDDAGAVLRQWLERQPDNTQALVFQGRVHEMRQQTPDAVARYRRVLELDPENDEGRLRLATVLVQLSQAEEALPHLKFLVKRQPDNFEIHVLMAQCDELLGDTDEAEKVLDGVLARAPHHPLALGERGKLARRLGDLEKAETLLKEAVARDPGSYATRYQLFLCLEQRHKTKEAREEHDRMQRLHEDLERHQKIMTHLMQARPRDADLRYEVAMIAIRSGAVKDGLYWLKSALEVNPNHGPSHRVLANYYQRMGNPGLAAHHRQLAEAAGEEPEGTGKSNSNSTHRGKEAKDKR
jgi:predicted Zn-dependent protease